MFLCIVDLLNISIFIGLDNYTMNNEQGTHVEHIGPGFEGLNPFQEDISVGDVMQKHTKICKAT